MNNIVLSALIMCFFSLPAGAVSPGEVKNAPSEMDIDTPIFSFRAILGTEMWWLCQAVDRPCGIEETQCDDLEPLGKSPMVELHSTTARKVLDEILRLHPSYRFALRNAVLNFEPASRDRPDPLATKLEQVSIHGSSSSIAAWSVIRQAGIEMDHRHGVTARGGMFEEANVTLELRNVTVREALNAIVKADGHSAWFFCTYKDNSGRFELDSWKQYHGSRESYYGSGKKP
jgi:hypothetical protein